MLKEILSEDNLVRIFCKSTLLKFKDGESGAGTYNRQDPTSYSWSEYGAFLLFGYKVDEDGHPLSETVRIEIDDCTWGITFNFYVSTGKVSGYFSRDNQKWYRTSDSFFRVFKDLMLFGENPENYCIEEGGCYA